MKQIRLKSFPILIGLLAVCLVIATRWHVRSMAQYNVLSELSNRDMYESLTGLQQAFLEDEVELNIKTGLLEFQGLRMGEPRGGSKQWLCKQFNFRYVLSTPYVWVNEPTLEAETQVSRLKNVKQIVIFGTLTDTVLERWKKRFPNARILTPRDIGRDKPYSGGFG